MTEVARLLEPLDDQFRKDLGLVCESHHLDDLGDTAKYKTSQPYGNSEEETANLQYSAILLRTADLLHITSDRTPSVAFRLINPKNPVSQDEWAKQQPVRRVRPKLGVNEEGIPDQKAPQDTVEVFAAFSKPNGFFGLSAYLNYAQSQLRKSFEWARRSRETAGTFHAFPWRSIDDSHIETEGFLPQPFEFTLDQNKILDLLTGHTLYNDSSVTIRELVQNSLDAVRLQAMLEKRHLKEDSIGKIYVVWRSMERVLSIEDNGTGMTQAIIENHLLRVGSSRYQDQDFVREFPDYSPISRFGIGLLSAFMIADDLEILTVHPEEAQARKIQLRSVHGKYLVQLIDKDSLPSSSILQQHGTKITLKLRASAKMSPVRSILEQWIVIPGCQVLLTIDSDRPVMIGFKSAKEALESFVQKMPEVTLEGKEGDLPRTRHRVEEHQINGNTIAVLLRWVDFFKVWTFETEARQHPDSLGSGICVEGIRVEGGSPGFRSDDGPVCLVNSRGKTAPRTNVARTTLEATPERESLFRAIYSAFANHISKELKAMQMSRGRSQSWAVQEVRLLAESQIKAGPAAPKELESTIAELPLVLLENNGRREVVSFSDVNRLEVFWTVYSPFIRSAEYLIRETSGSASVSALVNALALEKVALPDGPFICESYLKPSYLERLISGKEVRRLRISKDDRRLDMEWENRANPPRWISLSSELSNHLSDNFEGEMQQGFRHLGELLARFELTPSVRPMSFQLVHLASQPIPIEGLTDETIVRVGPMLFFLHGHDVTEYLAQLVATASNKKTPRDFFRAVYSERIIQFFLGQTTGLYHTMPERILRAIKERVSNIGDYVDFDELSSLLTIAPCVVFDPVFSARDRFFDFE